MASTSLGADIVRANILAFPVRIRPLRADVPMFDPTKDSHLRAWEAIWDFGQAAQKSDARKAIEANIEADIALLDAIDGDADVEDDNEDCCAAHDDCGAANLNGTYMWDGAPGDAVDAEDSDEDCCLCVDGAPPVYHYEPGLAYRTIAGGC